MRPFMFPEALGEDFFPFGGKTDGGSRATGERAFGLLYASKQDPAELAGGFVVQTEVRVLFHYVEGIAEFVREVWIGNSSHI